MTTALQSTEQTAPAANAGTHDYLATREWQIRQAPFRCSIVENLFTAPVYQRLCAAFDQKMTAAGEHTKRSKDYDAKILSLTHDDRTDFFPFLDLSFLSTLANGLELDITFEVDAAIHQHPPGSRNGWIHTDYNPGFFPRAAERDEVLLVDLGLCNYRTGRTRDESLTPVLRLRHLAMIYYLNNTGWSEGDGGETGLYSSREQAVEKPDIVVPPRDNSMVMFECSPLSYHAFMATRRVRNSLILWLHRDWQGARARWPDHQPDYWRS
jgi:hypothetical protein